MTANNRALSSVSAVFTGNTGPSPELAQLGEDDFFIVDSTDRHQREGDPGLLNTATWNGTTPCMAKPSSLDLRAITLVKAD